MKTAEFDFDLPETSIAAFPCVERDHSRLMVMDRGSGRFTEHVFSDIGALLPSGALLVLNDSRVIPARLHGTRKTGGHVELLLLRKTLRDETFEPGHGAASPLAPSLAPADAPGRDAELWEAIGKNLGHLEPGTELDFPGGLVVRFLARCEGGVVRLELLPPRGRTVAEWLEHFGEVPIPPYIVAARRRDPPDGPARATAASALDRERYQTVYASPPGSVAAPTAGLHFTMRLLEEVQAAGHQIAMITLHVGPGTFRPVKSEDLEDHHMDPEWYTVSPAAATAIEGARREERPIVAVGTTVVRALESAARATVDGAIAAGTASSRLFLSPGARFHVVTDLITNFHLPRSTLLMLVAAFAGWPNTERAYLAAIERGYRFYSYGDAMFIRGTP